MAHPGELPWPRLVLELRPSPIGPWLTSVDVLGHLVEIVLPEAARGESRRPEPEPAGAQGADITCTTTRDTSPTLAPKPPPVGFQAPGGDQELAELVGSLTRARVLVASDGAELQHPLGPAAICAFAAQVHEDQVIVRAPCKDRGLVGMGGWGNAAPARKLQQKT